MSTLAEMVASQATATADPPAAAEPPEAADTATSPSTTASDNGDTAATTAAADDNQAAEPEYSIRDYAKDLLGQDAHAAIENFKDDDEFLKSWHEAQKLIGRRNEDSQVVNWLREQGVTSADIQRIIAERNSGGQRSNGEAAKEWDPSWVTVDAKGNWVPTAKAPPDFEAKATRYRTQLAEAMTDPAKLAAFLKPHLASDIEGATRQTQEALEAKLAAQERTRTFEAWQQQKSKLFFSEGGQLTPLAKRVNQILNSGEINPQLDWQQQGEIALRIATSEQPKAETRAVPAKARRQTAPASGEAAKMDIDAFTKKYGHSLADWVLYSQEGKLPER